MKECKRADKWLTMMENFDDWRRGRKAKRLRSRVRKGVPDCVRGKVWQMMMGSTVSIFNVLCGHRRLFGYDRTLDHYAVSCVIRTIVLETPVRRSMPHFTVA